MSAIETCPAPSFARPEPPTPQVRRAQLPSFRCLPGLDPQHSPLMTQRSRLTAQTNGAQGRIRTSVAHNAADLQSAAINHSATCAFLLRLPQTLSLHHAEAARKRLRANISNWLVDTARRERHAVTTKLQNPSRGGVKLELAKGFEPPTA